MSEELVVRVETSWTEVGDKAYYILHEDFEIKSMGYCITVFRGFQTDFASVPRVPFVYAGFGNIARSHMPAMIHDALLRYTLVKRKKADQIFLDLLRKNGLSKIRSYIMYLAVRAFGANPKQKVEPRSEVVKCIKL